MLRAFLAVKRGEKLNNTLELSGCFEYIKGLFFNYLLNKRQSLYIKGMTVLKAGIVGLPNVGKSTLFNALTSSYQAESANYPFCTIEPNVGIVKVMDPRLDALVDIVNTVGQCQKVTPAVFEFVDIAGLVRGASQGEGLGNQFLATIREVDAIVQVVRCFEDDDITHVDGSVDPNRDIDTIMLELCLADASSLEKRMDKLKKQARGQDADAKALLSVFERVYAKVSEGEAIRLADYSEDDLALLAQAQLLTTKTMMYAGNVTEEQLADPMSNPHYKALTERAAAEGREVVAICAQIEAELTQISDDEKQDYLDSLGVTDSGVNQLIRAAFASLGLYNYFTAGVQEVRAWPFPVGFTAPQCAGIIHTDFEKGFIRAEVTSYDDYVANGGEKVCKEKGLTKLEGKEYIMKDGDVVYFRFNV